MDVATTKENLSKMANIDMNAAHTETCSCGGYIFLEITIIKKYSGLLVGADGDQFHHFKFLVCKKCGKPHSSNMDAFMKLTDTIKKPVSPTEPELTATARKAEE